MICDILLLIKSLPQVVWTDAVLHNSEWILPYLIYSFSSSTSIIIIVGDSYLDFVLSKY